MVTETKTLSETRAKRLASYHRDAVPIDENTRAHHDSLIGPVHLLNTDPDHDYFPLVQFIRRILVHLTVSSRSGWGTIGSYECTLMFMRRTNMGKDVWDDLYPNSGIDLLPFILSYIRDSPPAIVLEERTPPESSWGSWHDNEIMISRELVAAYLDLEKIKSSEGVLDPDDERSLVFLQTIILVTFLHELTHTLMKNLFRSRLGSLLDYGGIFCDVGEYTEKTIFNGPLLYVEWLRADFEGSALRVKNICSHRSTHPKEEFYNVSMEDLKTMLDSIDRSELYNPVYPVDVPISDPDVASADEKYVRIRITSEYEWQPPTTVTAVSIFPELGPDSILVERAPDRIFGQTMC
ncbi:hypothetical protein ARMSODRAFT_1002984 [Armillaria solidipes]|uniref:Uncharacterized protein n=1 Tax=Armillaria solidipes TaxID=1076256 RepID=A0A2H3BYL4_9AGAR|nr:hypothetical protein ARMSODRAFT_1002984 [Armillaria solidipes]